MYVLHLPVTTFTADIWKSTGHLWSFSPQGCSQDPNRIWDEEVQEKECPDVKWFYLCSQRQEKTIKSKARSFHLTSWSQVGVLKALGAHAAKKLQQEQIQTDSNIWRLQGPHQGAPGDVVPNSWWRRLLEAPAACARAVQAAGKATEVEQRLCVQGYNPSLSCSQNNNTSCNNPSLSCSQVIQPVIFWLYIRGLLPSQSYPRWQHFCKRDFICTDCQSLTNVCQINTDPAPS